MYNKISVSNIITSNVPNGIHTLTAERGYGTVSEKKKGASGPTVVPKLTGNEQPNYVAMK